MTQRPLTDLYRSPFVKAFLENPESLYPHYTHAPSLPQDPVVVTGQQVGLFGGPLYTLLKIRSAVQAAADLSKHHGVHIRPVFWLEDNDSDAAEASTVWLPETDGSLIKRTLQENNTRTPVGHLRFSADDIETIGQWTDRLSGRYADDVQARLQAIYTTERPWADAFEDLLRPFLAAWDVTVVRGSEIVRKGAHHDVLRRDLTSTELIDTIRDTSERLKAAGFELQADVPDALFFLEVDGERQRLERIEGGFRTPDGTQWSTQQLLEILETAPERFLPNVMGRPLMQDLALPNVATILGAAELAYHAQLGDVYPLIGRSQPTPTLRHHGSVLDAKAERLLDKLQITSASLYRPWQEVESDAVADDVSEVLDGLEHPEILDRLIAPYHEAAEEVDPTLVKSVEAARATVEKTLGGIRGKLRSAIKRSQQDRLDRLHAAWWMIYPNASVSERIIPLALWISRIGEDGLRIIVETLCTQPRTSFTEIGVSDIETD